MSTINRSKVIHHLALPKESWMGLFSSLIEAYNMSIYLFAAPFLATLLFQEQSLWKAIFFSYGLIFIGSSFLYPLGAIYYGLSGDKEGRQKICTYSTLGLAIATGMMGILPIAFLGEVAWLYFLTFICAQYFFSGGEYHGSVVFSLEHANDQPSGLMSSLSCLFAVFGLGLASGLASLALITDNETLIRGCFLLGGFGGLISYFIKYYCKETPAFTASQTTPLAAKSLATFIRAEAGKIGGCILVLGLFLVIYSYIFIFLPLVQLENAAQQFDTFKSLIAYGLLLVTAGYLADRWGIGHTMSLGAGFLCIILVPLSYFCSNLLVLQLAFTAFACLVIGPIHSWLIAQFPVQERCKGIFISSAAATAVFNGSTVPICLMIFEQTGSVAVCSVYPMAFALGAFIYLRSR